jgi:uncharacterized protein
MDIHGTTRIPASPEMVWKALNDPVVLAQCVAGCESFEELGPGEFAATGSLRVGPVHSRIAVNITITESNPPAHAVVRFTARGKLGRAEAVANIHLADREDGTDLQYEAHAVFGGQLGRFAGRWAGGAAEELVGEFFTRFATAIPAATGAAVTTIVRASPPITRPQPIVPPVTQRLSPHSKAMWIGIGAAAGAAVTAAAALLISRKR